MPTLRSAPPHGVPIHCRRTTERLERDQRLRLDLLAAELQELLEARVLNRTEMRRIMQLCLVLSNSATAYVSKGRVIVVERTNSATP
ncbi:MAG: hypothetical protein IT229_03535 [Flavobacteriales bacterium]|nr:hypothetical protein [Flavobacteriales bacterium]